jgi:hypothetical protein
MVFLHKKNSISRIFLLSFFILCGFLAASQSYAADLHFSPVTGDLGVGSIFKVSLLTDTQSESINSAEATVNFPADLLEVVSVSKINSIFSFWVQDPTFSNTNGTISFSGGLPTPGFLGSNGKILEVVFKAKKAGDASLLFSSGSVRANDGLGTDLLKNRGQALFTLTAGKPVSTPTPTPVSTNLPATPVITSPTNPNDWSNNPSPKFVWQVPSDVVATRILYDKYANTIPWVLYAPAIAEKQLINLKDGIYYFHAQLENSNGWSKAAHFKFQIDTKNPDSLTITEITRDDQTIPQVKFTLNATDALSGIDHFEIQIDDATKDTWSDTGSHEYQTVAIGPGVHTLFVSAFDKAGNFITSSSTFTIAPIKTPEITEYPQKVSTPEDLIVKGLTYPTSEVTLWLQKEGGEPKSFTVMSDGSGKFVFTNNTELSVGTYKLWADVKDNRGARSLPTEKLTITVESFSLIQSVIKIMSSLLVPILLIILFILIILIIWYSLRKFFILRRQIQKETYDAERNIHKAFDLLAVDLRSQIQKLNKVNSERDLNIIKNIRKSLDEAESLIKKEIQDLEK